MPLLPFVFAAVVAAALPPQPGLKPPPHWKVALDDRARAAGARIDPDTARYDFVRMPPGFHVTMGPGALLWDPRRAAEDRYEVRSELFVFPNSGDAEYGVFVGGRQLGTSTAAWTAFVLRRDGAFAVLRRSGGRTTAVVPFTVHPAVKPATTNDVPLNAITVRVDSAVTMHVNGTEVARLDRAQVQPDGAVGYRMGRMVNIHAATFDLLQHMAPVPGTAAAARGPQTVYVVRHAEREDRSRDSDLSAAGRARAAALDSALAEARITHVVVTEFRRTQHTAAPTAARHGVVPRIVANDADVSKHAAAVAAAVRAAGPGASVLVVGHSNTVPKIVAALGGAERPDLCDTQYATLTVVRLEPGAPAAVARGSYGTPDAGDAANCARTMTPPASKP